MPKFMILYNFPKPAGEVMAQSSPEDVKASMAEWIAWKKQVEGKVKFDFGMLLQAASHLTAEVVGESDSQVSGYSTMEGEKETVVELLKSHPHLKRPGATIDVLEELSMPGMEG